jgi:hypothetical protein
MLCGVIFEFQKRPVETRRDLNVVRELEGARKLREANQAMLIVSSAFTPRAIESAKQLGIELIDGDQLQAKSHTTRASER